MNNIIKVFFLTVVVFIINCNKNDNANISFYIQSSKEVINFCKLMVPCIQEEIQNIFKNDPQQREYLLSKSTIYNCQLEQGEKLNSLLELTDEQIQSFSKELNEYQKDYDYAKKNNQLEEFQKKNKYKIKTIEATFDNLKPFLNEKQFQILMNYLFCINQLNNSQSCNIKKNILKNNTYCRNIFSK
ncbi:MAG: hypothetical protein KatS3mg129_2616 [Leptospiraceae bacterium]|nr:MAG: hypothetical protein KatS3mg129_2616 [Leptospiraceae bacterium]